MRHKQFRDYNEQSFWVRMASERTKMGFSQENVVKFADEMLESLRWRSELINLPQEDLDMKGPYRDK